MNSSFIPSLLKRKYVWLGSSGRDEPGNDAILPFGPCWVAYGDLGPENLRPSRTSETDVVRATRAPVIQFFIRFLPLPALNSSGVASPSGLCEMEILRRIKTTVNEPDPC